MTLFKILTGSLLALLAVFPVYGQFQGAIEGTITDPSGATVQDANITLTNSETGQKQVTKSSAEGFYRFDGLAPGRYSIAVKANGFKQETLENINLWRSRHKASTSR
ncbi:MAG: carboxypeptidase-like regulatory domain-containing protein [Bryobacteraceae bacterium]